MESVIRDEEWTPKIIYVKLTSKKAYEPNGFLFPLKTNALAHHV